MAEQRLSWRGKVLQNDDQRIMDLRNTVDQYMIYPKCVPPTVDLLFRLKGGYEIFA